MLSPDVCYMKISITDCVMNLVLRNFQKIKDILMNWPEGLKKRMNIACWNIHLLSGNGAMYQPKKFPEGLPEPWKSSNT